MSHKMMVFKDKKGILRKKLMMFFLLGGLFLFPFFDEFNQESVFKTLVNPFNHQKNYGLFQCESTMKKSIIIKKNCITMSKIGEKQEFEINYRYLNYNIFEITFKNFDIEKILVSQKSFINNFTHVKFIIPYQKGRINKKVKIFKKNQLIGEMNFRDDFPHGESLFYRNRKLQVKQNYQNGYLHGKSMFFNRNQDLVETVLFENGVKQGKYYLYYPNGEYRFKCQYVDGYLEGPCQSYTDKGKLLYDLNFIKGTISLGNKFINDKKIPINEAQRLKIEKIYN